MEHAYILGHPVAHSKSPAMHNAVYRDLGLNWEYGFADCETEADARVFLNVRNWRALNVTTPWKPLAYELSDERSAAADLAQGANVLVNWGERVYADNTDGKGCVGYLKRCGVAFENARVAVCGTGPTSTAIMHACAEAGVAQVALLGRDAGKARQTLSAYRARLEGGATEVDFQAGAYGESADVLERASLIIDATPLGMNPEDPAPFDVALLHGDQVVFDVVYGHGETALLHAARAAGCAAYDGSGMLVAQAVETVRDIADITGAFSIPAHLDLFSVMANAAGFML